MSKGTYLLHPELIESIPIGSNLLGRNLGLRVEETLVDNLDADPNISLVIRALNEAEKLEQLFADIHRQLFQSEVEVIVVDNDSTDRTPQVAKYYGAEVVNLPRGSFTYPKSMNLGFIAASHDVVLTTVGHANLSNIYSFHAGARHFNDGDVGGAYAGVLHNEGASTIERYASIAVGLELMKPAHRIKRARIGVLAATSAMISKAAWEELGRFDERYETGGEDTALAAKMLANCYDVLREPAMTVHHSHGLGVIDSIKQLRGWQQTLKAPRKLDKDKLFARRPDLLANFDKDTFKA